MKNLLLILLLMYSVISFSQEKRTPTILILNPQETIVDQALDSIAKTYVYEGNLTDEYKERVRESNGENFELKSEKEILFMKKKDLGSEITLGLNTYLTYKVFEYFQNLMIYPAHETNTSTKSALKKIAEKHNMNWVVNIPKVVYSKDEKGMHGEIRCQLYNLKSDQMVLDEKLTADDQNPGFTFTCETGTINCVNNNLINAVSSNILNALGKNRNYWR